MAREKEIRRVDIHTVARHARVSIATVSRVMNQVSTVDGKLAARVSRAARDLNYLPNTQARALVSGRSRMLGLIVSEITNPFFPELIRSFEDAAIERGYEVLLGSTNYSPERMTQCVRRMIERKVEGCAVMTFGMAEDLIGELITRGTPVVAVGASGMEAAAALEVDYGKGIREAVQHLAVLGHRDIAFISGPLALDSARERRNCFVAAMRDIGIKPPANFLLEGDHTVDGGFAVARKLVSSATLPTAIMCSNDMTAIGALHALASRGLRVPDDVSVIGFDDIHMAQFTMPPLTTVRMAAADLASAAFRALPLEWEGRPTLVTTAHERVPTSLIVRQSTGYAATRAASQQAARRSTAAPRAKSRKPSESKERL